MTPPKIVAQVERLAAIAARRGALRDRCEALASELYGPSRPVRVVLVDPLSESNRTRNYRAELRDESGSVLRVTRSPLAVMALRTLRGRLRRALLDRVAGIMDLLQGDRPRPKR